MTYSFTCEECHKVFDIDIPLAEYDVKKGTQICPICGIPLLRQYSVSITRPTGDNRGFYGTTK